MKYLINRVLHSTTAWGVVFAVLLQAAALWAAPNTVEGPVRAPHVTAELVPAQRGIQPGKPFTVALRLEIEPHWHTYYLNPGDSGLPTALDWELPEGFTVSEIQWASPRRLPFGPLINFGYEGTVLHVVTVTPPTSLAPGDTVTLRARADWLVCKEICLPGSADLALSLPVVSADRAVEDSAWANEFDAFAAARPVDLAGSARVTASVDPAGTVVTIRLEDFSHSGPLHFYPDQEGWLENVPVPVVRKDGKATEIRLAITAAPPGGRVAGILVSPDSEPFSAGDGRSASTARIDVEWGDAGRLSENSVGPGAGFLWTLMLGFLGGLILNLMPCVFPVLGIKIMGFVQQGGQDRRKVAAHGMIFTLGVLVSFWLLASVLLVLRTAGQEIGWGFQLQSPGFVFALTVFLFAFALNLSGLFEFGASFMGICGQASSTGGWSGSFFSGVLATVVATPCAAPFLAPALGAALSLPAGWSLILFTAIALGLSAPYLVLSVWPELVRRLPRPGAWMESFKQFMAFPLFGTAAYLLWVLDGQVSEASLLRILLALVLTALGLWVFGRWGTPVRSVVTRRIATMGAVAICLLSWAWAWPSSSGSTESVTWQPWSRAAVDTHRASGRPVFIDFTARWCATCQTNKAIVFSDDEVLNTFRDLNVAALKADWTNQDPEITRELARFNRSAVPFNLIYLPGREEPVILPELLTPEIVLRALRP